MDRAYLIYQGKDDTFAGPVLLEAVRHGEDGVATALIGHAVRAVCHRSCSFLHWLDAPRSTWSMFRSQQLIGPPFPLLGTRCTRCSTSSSRASISAVSALVEWNAIPQKPRFFILYQKICPGIIAPPDFFDVIFLPFY